MNLSFLVALHLAHLNGLYDGIRQALQVQSGAHLGFQIILVATLKTSIKQMAMMESETF